MLITTGRYIAMADWNAEEKCFQMTSREDAILISVKTITHWMPLPELPKERHNDWERELLLCDGVTVESRLFPPLHNSEQKAQEELLHLVGRAPEQAGQAGSRWKLETIRAACPWLEPLTLSGVWRVLGWLKLGLKRGLDLDCQIIFSRT